MNALRAVALAILVVAGLAAASPAPTAAEHNAAGVEAYNAKRWDEAVAQFRQIRLPGEFAAGHDMLESVAHPGRFLRHSSFVLSAQANDGSDLFARDSAWLVNRVHGEGHDIYVLGHVEEVSLPWKRQALPELGFEVCRNRRR